MRYSNLLNTTSSRSSIARTIATAAIALSVAVVVLSGLVADGFRREIEQKTVEALDYIRIKQASSFFVTEDNVELDEATIAEFQQIIYPSELVGIVQQEAIIQRSANLLPSMLLSSQEVRGGMIVLSQSAAAALDAKCGDELEVLTHRDGLTKLYSYTVDSIYNSGLGDIDQALAYISMEDARLISELEEGVMSYYAISDVLPSSTYETLYGVADSIGLYIEGVDQRAPQVLGWLDMVDSNIVIVLIIMLIVAIINVITSTLIIMLDNTKTVALLRAFGMTRGAVRRIFMLGVGRIAVRGIIIGLFIAVTLGFLQMETGLFGLDETWYFVNTVPIYFNIAHICLYVVLMVVSIFVALILPISVVSRIDIASAIKYQ